MMYRNMYKSEQNETVTKSHEILKNDSPVMMYLQYKDE